jgi:excisionase family DNA binding protein
MTALLRTKDIQKLIDVDRSTIYRMAEDGRIPAIKVGRQWRFPEDQIEEWLASNSSSVPAVGNGLGALPHGDLRTTLPLEGIQATADLVADIFGAMTIVTDIDGVPITEVSNPCGLFEAVSASPETLPRCIETWREFGSDLDFEPHFRPSHLGFLCARGFIRVGARLEGMVIVGGIAPEDWPPPPAQVERLAAELRLPAATLSAHIHEIFRLDATERARILAFVPRVGVLISHLANERAELMTKFEAIAALAGTKNTRRSTT